MSEKKEEKNFNQNPGPTFKEFLWNPGTKELLGRTAESWVKIVIFYIIFYICLASFFGFCLYIFHFTLEDGAPKWKLEASLIGTNPGLGFRPMPDQDANPESTLIWYKQASENDRTFWSKQVEDFVNKTYAKDSEALLTCDYEGVSANKEKACRVDLNVGFPCSQANEYGYPKGEPCIILKLNKVYGWKPEGYGINDNGDYDKDLLEKELASEKERHKMPDQLINYIKREIEKQNNPKNFLNTVWISCDGENPSDEETIGELEYLPQPGIPGYYFPYYNQKGYQTPIIFLKMKKPFQGVLINVECKAWARNIFPDRQTRVGSVHFELLID